MTQRRTRGELSLPLIFAIAVVFNMTHTQSSLAGCNAAGKIFTAITIDDNDIPTYLCVDGSETVSVSVNGVNNDSCNITLEVKDGSAGDVTITPAQATATVGGPDASFTVTGASGGALILVATIVEGTGSPCTDESEEFTVVEVDLDVDANYDGDIDDPDGPDDTLEVTTGGLVKVGEREKIEIRRTLPTTYSANVELSWASSKIEVYESATGGTPKTSSYQFASPKTLYVKGVTVSDAHGDETLTLKSDDAQACSDEIVFTVIEHALVLQHKNGPEVCVDTQNGDDNFEPRPFYVCVDADGDADMKFKMHDPSGTYDWTLTGTPTPPSPTSGNGWNGTWEDTGDLEPGTYTLTSTSTGAGGAVRKIEFTIIKVEMVTPENQCSGDSIPDGRQWHYYFNDASPGVCTVLCRIKTTPDTQATRSFLTDKITLTIDGIQGSTQTWVDDATYNGDTAVYTSDEWQAKAKYTTLPADNDEFGPKTVSYSVTGTDIQVQGTFRVFFTRDAKNSPGSQSGTHPNWIYYWSQTDAAKDDTGQQYPFYYGGVRQGMAGASYYSTTERKWVAVLYDGAQTYRGLTNIKAEPDQDYYWEFINRFAYTVRHEDTHRQQAIDMWGVGGGEQTPYDVDDDTDGDLLKDDCEEDFFDDRDYDVQNDPTHDDDWEYGSRYTDCEDACLWAMPWPGENDYDSEDWARQSTATSVEGSQWGNGYTDPEQ